MSPKRGIWMRALTGAVCASAVVGLGGCLTWAAVQRASEEREVSQRLHAGPVEEEWFEREGFALSGSFELTTPQTVWTTRGARQVERQALTCDGLGVRLIPDTPHHRWLLEHRMGFTLEPGGEWRSGVPGLHRWSWLESPAFVREVQCGPGGAFNFPAIPDGRYFFMASLNPPSYNSQSRVDFILKPIVVEGGPRRSALKIAMGDSILSRTPRN